MNLAELLSLLYSAFNPQHQSEPMSAERPQYIATNNSRSIRAVNASR